MYCILLLIVVHSTALISVAAGQSCSIQQDTVAMFACTTGALHSCKQAFAWQRAVVRCLVRLADQPAELSKQCRVLADMLVSTSSKRFAPHLHVNTRLVLAVGGYQTSLKSTDDGPALLAWLQGRLEVPVLPCPSSLCSGHTACGAYTSHN